MLVLSRRVGETIHIRTLRDVIEIKLLEITGESIRLGIEAPVNIPIVRGELLKEVDDE